MSKTDIKTIEINGVEYIRADSVPGADVPKGDCVIVRTYSAGVHFGILESREGKEVTLRNTRRIWKWEGAASLSQLAKDGTSNPNGCKFPAATDSILLTEAIEVIPCTEKAVKSIRGVTAWVA